MHHVGPKTAKRPFDLPVARQVAPRMDRPSERGDDFQGHPPCPCPIQQTPFRPERRSSNQQNVVAVPADEILTAEHGVFLCPAEDQSRDDVGDAHGEAMKVPYWPYRGKRDCLRPLVAFAQVGCQSSLFAWEEDRGQDGRNMPNPPVWVQK